MYVLDPINSSDYSGMFSLGGAWSWVKRNIIPIVVFVVAVVIAAVVYIPHGDPDAVMAEEQGIVAGLRAGSSGGGNAAAAATKAAPAVNRVLNNANRIAPSETQPLFKAGQLAPHFESHGPSMGYGTSEEYLSGAQTLIRSSNVQTFMRANGDKLFYNAQTNEFGVLTKDNIIRTYFQPDDGIFYWLEQTQGK